QEACVASINKRVAGRAVTRSASNREFPPNGWRGPSKLYCAGIMPPPKCEVCTGVSTTQCAMPLTRLRDEFSEGDGIRFLMADETGNTVACRISHEALRDHAAR